MNQRETVPFPGAWVNVKHIRDGKVIWEAELMAGGAELWYRCATGEAVKFKVGAV